MSTDYGSAVNGTTYGGVTVGAGWDCTIRRESRHVALVLLDEVGGDEQHLIVVPVEPEDDLQSLAVAFATHPSGAHADTFEGLDRAEIDGDDNAWDSLKSRWDRARSATSVRA